MTRLRPEDIPGVVSGNMVNAMLSELSAWFASIGGLIPVARTDAEATAHRLLMVHVALKCRHEAAMMTDAGAIQYANRYAALWEHHRDRVLALIPIDERGRDRLN